MSKKMEFNICDTCGAKDGRCGLLVNSSKIGLSECINCNDTRQKGEAVIHSHLSRTPEEIQKTIAILNNI